jgi:hypothetical protein
MRILYFIIELGSEQGPRQSAGIMDRLLQQKLGCLPILKSETLLKS